MDSQKEYALLVDVIAWIQKHTSGLKFEGADKVTLATACFDVAIEHQAAIALLHGGKLHAAEFALLRSLAESVIRGLWLTHCATEDQIELFKAAKLGKPFGQLIDEISVAVGDKQAVLAEFKKTAWDALNGFTHTGLHQLSRRHKDGRLEANFSDEDLTRGLGLAVAFGMMAAGQLIELSDRREELQPVFLGKMAEHT
jgi:hypothetical protein